MLVNRGSAAGIMVHRPTCHAAKRGGAREWRWAQTRTLEDIRAEAIRRDYRTCRQCHPIADVQRVREASRFDQRGRRIR
jgi:hypothetical protein